MNKIYETISSAYLGEDEYREATKTIYEENFWSSLDVFKDHNGFINGEVHTFIGAKGAGKSTWAKSIISELAYMDKRVLLYASEEETSKYIQIINSTFRKLNKDESKIKSWLENVAIISEIDSRIKSYDAFFDAVKQIITALKIEIFIFDNFTTSFLSEQFINKQSESLRAMKVLAMEFNIPVLLFFHTGKGTSKKELDGDSVRGSATAVNIGSYNYLIRQKRNDNGELVNFIYTEKARYHSKANKTLYRAIYEPRTGLFVRTDRIDLEEYTNNKQGENQWV